MIGVVGSSGFIGRNLMDKIVDAVPITRYDLESDYLQNFREVYIAAPSANKYEVNMAPRLDRNNIDSLFSNLRRLNKNTQVTIFSTVDVYENISLANEFSATRTDVSYGGNRAYFEKMLLDNFHNIRVLRLGGLFGKHLKKNLVFDIKHKRPDQIQRYNPKSTFQWTNIEKVIELVSKIRHFDSNIINITNPPISVDALIGQFKFNQDSIKVNYDVQSKVLDSPYVQSVEESFKDLRNFLED